VSPRTRLRRALLRFPRLFLQLCEPDDGELGLLGEAIAADHLARHGWRILRRRLRTRQGEADLVVLRGRTLAVVEVKTGRAAPFPRPAGRALPDTIGRRWRPGGRCDARRLARLERVAREVAAALAPPRPDSRPRARVDLVEVLLEVRARRFRVLHHEDLREPLA